MSNIFRIITVLKKRGRRILHEIKVWKIDTGIVAGPADRCLLLSCGDGCSYFIEPSCSP
ncbi:hypothetical protein STFR1_30584 [Bacillus vallismortis]